VNGLKQKGNSRGKRKTQGVIGQKPREINPGEFRQAGFVSWLYTTKNFLTSNGQAMVGLARGTAKAYVFAFENPECAVLGRLGGISRQQAEQRRQSEGSRGNRAGFEDATGRQPIGQRGIGHGERQSDRTAHQSTFCLRYHQERNSAPEYWTTDLLKGREQL
jgi:hypothetical protein